MDNYSTLSAEIERARHSRNKKTLSNKRKHIFPTEKLFLQVSKADLLTLTPLWTLKWNVSFQFGELLFFTVLVRWQQAQAVGNFKTT